MKRALRVMARLAGGLGTVAILGLTATLSRVNPRPFAEQDYATVAAKHLADLAAPPGGRTWHDELRAGFGRAPLTPKLGCFDDRPEFGEFRALPLAGYGQRQGRPATGVHDELWAKAVAFSSGGRTGVVIAADLLIVPREVADATAERLRERCGLGRDELYFGATHTHGSLGGWGIGFVAEAFAGPFNPAVRTWIVQQLATAGEQAVRDLGPAGAGGTAFAAPDLTRNRLVGDRGLVDGTFSLMLVRQTDGDQAVVGSYAAHATVMPASDMDFGGDYPGFWQRAVEEQPGTLALFLAGAVGSHSPRPPAGGLEGARRMGEILAERTAAALADVHPTNRPAFGLVTARVRLPELQVRLSDGWRLRPWVARRLLPVAEDTRLQVLRLGDQVWLSTPCDYSGELALRLKSAPGLQDRSIAVTSFNGDYVGYVVPAEYYPLNTYESRTMSFFGPQLPGYFDHVLTRLAVLAYDANLPAGQPQL